MADTDLQRRFELYSDYGRTLRLWLVAYGIGGPVLFLTRDEVYQRILASGRGPTIVILFLLGTLFQVVSSAINKWAAWYVYRAGRDEESEEAFPYSAAFWISDQFWIDLLLDIGTIAAFAWATLATLLVFVA